MTVQPPPAKPYAAPKLRTFTPESWQARLVAECEGLQKQPLGHIVTVIVGEGPVRWWVGRPAGIDRSTGKPP